MTRARTDFPEIVRRAIIHGVMDLGQLTDSERKILRRYVRLGYLERGKGGPFPIVKTVFARRGFPFSAARQWAIEQMIAEAAK